MKDIKDRLNNRTDLEKLEQDLVEIERQVDQGLVGEKIKKLTRQARRDLEAARSVHIKLIPQLISGQPAERQAARREVERRIAAGETKLFDPETDRWRAIADVLDESLRDEERLARREAEICQIEAQLKDSTSMPRFLHQLHHLILRAEDVLPLENLSQESKAGLNKAREMYDSGCLLHRRLTLDIYTGSLKERSIALEELRELIKDGESWILVAPKNVWLPSDQALTLAERSLVEASNKQSVEAIKRAEKMAQTNLQAAIHDLYKAMDESIPYKFTDREKLKAKYTELLNVYHQQEKELPNSAETKVSATDKVGFMKVRASYLQRMNGLADQSLGWLNQFFHPTITQPVGKLLKEAQDEKTSPARTVELIDMAIGLAKNAMIGSIEIPESMIRGAMILYNKGILDRARNLLIAACPLYTLNRADKIHRHAVAAWILGCVEFSLGNRFEGYSNWKTSRGLFEDLHLQALKDNQIDKANWYSARLKEMATFAIQSFEEVYFQWMNQVDPIVLTESLNEYRTILDKQLGSDQIVPLRKTLRQYLEQSHKQPVLEVQWVTLVDAAFYEYEIKDYLTALDLLNRAWVGFQSNHRGAVILWLSGLIQWWFPSKVNAAVQNWETSIRIFQNLSREANLKDQMSLHHWYDTQIEIMSSSLKEWIQLTKTG